MIQPHTPLPDNMAGDKSPYQAVAQEIAATDRSSGAADNAGWAKLDVIATVSHEIRTPVNGILGLSRLLLESDIGSEPLAWAQMIQTSATRLLEIVNDILDISKLEAGRVELNDAPYVVRELLDTVLDTLRPKALEKNIRLTSSISSSLPAALRGDVRRLGQILFNLVGNAIKFTDSGQVTVEIGLLGAPAGDDRKMRLRVLDTGIGIPPDALPALFEKFTQADTSISRRFGGTGLGLAICRELVILMGGHISAASVPGQGSCFSVVLPLRTLTDNQLGNAAGPLENRRPVMGKTQRRGRVLIAEDNDINRYIVVTALRKAGFHVTAVANGMRAVDAARQQDFDLILMDMQMPEMDGPQATRLIRALPGQRGTLPIVALTANAMAGVRERCLATGMNAYLTKPIDPRRLVDFVATTIGRSQEERACAQSARQRIDEIPVVETETGNEVRKLLGEQSWRNMVHGFASCLPMIRDQAGCLLATHAYAQLGALMHQLVSSAGTLGLRRLESLARRMEESIRCDRREGLPELLACLNEETALALTALARQTRAVDKSGNKEMP